MSGVWRGSFSPTLRTEEVATLARPSMGGEITIARTCLAAVEFQAEPCGEPSRLMAHKVEVTCMELP